MLNRKIRRYFPEAGKIKSQKILAIFGATLHDPYLWHLNRKSVPAAFAIGLFMAFVPIPFQMVPAAAAAIFFRANIIISTALVWITNPITLAPIFFFCYKVGTWLIGKKPTAVSFDLSWEWMTTVLTVIWQPFLLGCLVVGSTLALVGYYTMQLVWRLHVVSEWEKRKEIRAMRKG